MDYSNVKSYLALNSIFDREQNITLEGFQTVDVLKLLTNKRGILIYDTGLGKTYVASAFMRILNLHDRNAKHIFFCKNSQLEQTPNKIEQVSGLRVRYFSARADDVKLLKYTDVSSYDVLILTHEVLNNSEAMRYLYAVRELFKSIIIDEAHEVCNYYGSQSGEMLRSVVYKMEYRIALTATPITTSTIQLAQLTHILDRNMSTNAYEFAKLLDGGYPIVEENPDFYIVRTRKEVEAVTNYKTKLLLIPPMSYQKGAHGKDLSVTVKGNGATRQVHNLIKVINTHIVDDEKGLVYIRHHAVRKWVVENLTGTDIRFACINGEEDTIGADRKASRKEIYDLFNDGELDVVITSVTHGIDLECDYIFFYEFYTDIRQMLGRGHRDLNPKDLIIYFMFTLDTDEIDYFMRTIYSRSLTVQMVLNQSVDKLIEAGMSVKRVQREVDRMNLEKDIRKDLYR